MGPWPMNILIDLQGATVWLLLAGVLVLVMAFVSRQIERVPRTLDTALFWGAGVLLVVGVLGFIAPYLVVFFAARPA